MSEKEKRFFTDFLRKRDPVVKAVPVGGGVFRLISGPAKEAERGSVVVRGSMTSPDDRFKIETQGM